MVTMKVTRSRFAVLRIENDEEEKAAQRERDRQRAAELKAAGKGSLNEKSKQFIEKNAAKSAKTSKETAELKALAFGSQKLKKSSTASSKHPKVMPQTSASQEAPTEWKKKDEELVSQMFEKQLKEALLASKLDFEEKKDVYKAYEKEATIEQQKKTKRKTGNKKGTMTLSLDEFNLQLCQLQAPTLAENHEPTSATKNEDEGQFFEKLTEEANKIASNDKMRTETAKKQKKLKPVGVMKVSEVSDAFRLAQLEEELSKTKEELSSLRLQNDKLQEELVNVKLRSKRLCNILAQGEMREKAELLIEMEKLAAVKDELTAEVENLSSQLQQERTKSNALSDVKRNKHLKEDRKI